MFFLSVCVAEDPANRAREEKKHFRSRQTARKQGTNHSDLYSRWIDLPRSNAVAREARTFAYVPLATRKMNQYAKFEAFYPDEENWSEYAERLDMAFVVNGVDDADTNKKRAIVLTVCGKKTFALLKALSAPNKPSEVSFANL